MKKRIRLCATFIRLLPLPLLLFSLTGCGLGAALCPDAGTENAAPAPESGMTTPQESTIAPQGVITAPQNAQAGPDDAKQTASQDAAPAQAADAQSAKPDAEPVTPTADTKAATSEISLDDARQAALKDAGVSEADAVFTEEKLDTEHGQKVYDLEFYTSQAEYEYEIKVSDGSIYSRKVEAFAQDTTQPSGDGPISLEQAKSIALNHANVSEGDVRFKEAELDRDDGIQVYEIEFYSSGKEYEYKIRSSDGSILEYDIDSSPEHGK